MARADQGFIDSFLDVARALISQDIVDVSSVEPRYSDWARRALLGSNDITLVDGLAKLAQATDLARADRFIELRLVSPGTSASEEVTDIDPMDRFWLVRQVGKDHRQFAASGLETSLDGQPAISLSSYRNAADAAATLSSESDFASTDSRVLLYASTYYPALPSDFLDEGVDPLESARDFVRNLPRDQELEIFNRVISERRSD